MRVPPWLEETWRSLSARLERKQLPHALLITGAPGLGKRQLVDALLAAALCEQRDADGFACGRCRACVLMAAGSHPDRSAISFGFRDDGKQRTEITVDQIRELSQKLSLSTQFGGLQLVTIDPAEAMNANAANALLKTLEEPTSSTVIVLVTDRPARLPATIRSRCQRIEVRPPALPQAREWLLAQAVNAGQVDAALQASLGNPGQALQALGDDSLGLRDACARDLALLRSPRGSALAVAEAWKDDRPAERLWHAAVLVREESIRLAQGEPAQLGLTDATEIPKLAAWFASANRARELLNSPLRGELVLLDLLHSWQLSRRN